MRVLLFNQIQNDFPYQALAPLLETTTVADCRTLDELFAQLRSYATRPEIVVVCVTDAQVLQALVEARELLADISIVLLLPNQCPEILSLAHRLRPRFVDAIDENTDGLAAVLRRMIPPESPGTECV